MVFKKIDSHYCYSLTSNILPYKHLTLETALGILTSMVELVCCGSLTKTQWRHIL